VSAHTAAQVLHLRLCEHLGIDPGRGSRSAVAEHLEITKGTYSTQLGGRVTLDLVQARAAAHGWTMTVRPDGAVEIRPRDGRTVL
jgi:hypothetical protein